MSERKDPCGESDMRRFFADKKIAVVIPMYRVTEHVADVIAAIDPIVYRIYAVDDACPDGSADYVETHCRDPRVIVIRHLTNRGVGGAVMTGYKAAINDKVHVIVKIDGDGQMDPTIMSSFVIPVLSGDADYTKGNRFYDLESVRTMPAVRLIGNGVLSFMNKLSSGYWNIFDPTNGYTAISVVVASHLPFDKISPRYFFESDLLFRLNTLRAVVVDIPMDAKYGDEISNLRVETIIGEFLISHVQNNGMVRAIWGGIPTPDRVSFSGQKWGRRSPAPSPN
jgi:glycosyltransferase involved in cell wall biosynthesis